MKNSFVWGDTAPEITDGENTCVFEHAVIEPNFLKSAEIMHEAINGHRTWSKHENYVAFSMMDFLCDYENPAQKVLEILAFEDKNVTFTYATNGGMIQNMCVVNVDFFPLTKPYANEVALIEFMNVDFIQFSRRLRAIPGKEWIKEAGGKILRSKGIII